MPDEAIRPDSGPAWPQLVLGIVRFVEFEAVLDDGLADRVARLMVGSRTFHAPARRQAEAIDRALAGSVPMPPAGPVPREEPEVRDFLRRLRGRLESLRPWPAWRYGQVPLAEWGTGPVRPVARLALSPQSVTNELGVLFEPSDEGGVSMEYAVVQVFDGPRVALAREVGAPTLATTVLYRGDDPAEVVLGQFLDATGLGAGAVVWPRG